MYEVGMGANHGINYSVDTHSTTTLIVGSTYIAAFLSVISGHFELAWALGIPASILLAYSSSVGDEEETEYEHHVGYLDETMSEIEEKGDEEYELYDEYDLVLPTVKICPECGTEFESTSKVCPACGCDLVEVRDTLSPMLKPGVSSMFLDLKNGKVFMIDEKRNMHVRLPLFERGEV